MARRRRRQNRTFRNIAALTGGVLAVSVVGRAAREHLVIVLIAGAAALAAAGAWGYRQHTRARQFAEAEHGIDVTDTMTGPEFEQYVAKLMRAGGCRQVRVSGGRRRHGRRRDRQRPRRPPRRRAVQAIPREASAAPTYSASPEPPARSTVPTSPCW
jgi:hypothetical protein